MKGCRYRSVTIVKNKKLPTFVNETNELLQKRLFLKTTGFFLKSFQRSENFPSLVVCLHNADDCLSKLNIKI